VQRADGLHQRPEQPGTVVLAFEDGTGTVIAGLPGYTASVSVLDGRVINVSYAPSINTPRWVDYSVERGRVERARSIAAAAAQAGVLAVD
jgi:hypothetical protein